MSLATPAAAGEGPSGLYGPVAADLPAVDALLDGLCDVEFPWLREMLEAALGGGGKRLRPAIALLAGRLGRYDIELLAPMAASVELLHTATLVHDDVIDAAEERRGRPTAAARFNNAPSVMLGDYMFAHAAEFVARTGNIRVIRNFADTLRVMARGELSQDLAAWDYSPDVRRYLDRIHGKTASLFATAAEGGAILGGASEPLIEACRRFGERLGMAFQVADDVLDFTASSEELGKPAGSDLLAGTLTLPALLYLERHPADNPIRRAFGGVRRRANLQRAVAEIRESGLIAESLAAGRRFADEALEAASELPDGEPRATFERLAAFAVERGS